jgi:hypothetical protein
VSPTMAPAPTSSPMPMPPHRNGAGLTT